MSSESQCIANRRNYRLCKLRKDLDNIGFETKRVRHYLYVTTWTHPHRNLAKSGSTVSKAIGIYWHDIDGYNWSDGIRTRNIHMSHDINDVITKLRELVEWHRVSEGGTGVAKTCLPLMKPIDQKHASLECPVCGKVHPPKRENKDGGASYQCNHPETHGAYTWRIDGNGDFID